MSAFDDPLTSKEQARPGTPEERDAPKPNAMQASFSEALDQRAIERERKAHASLQETIMGAAGPLSIAGTPAARRIILLKCWNAALMLRRWSDDLCPSLPEEADLPNRAAREKALESLWEWAQRTLKRLPGPPPLAGIEWTPPDSPRRWAQLFDCSLSTLKRRFEDGSIRHKKLTSKRYQIAVDDLPAIHQSKFRTAQKPPAK
jgi:hypothetical protein